MARCKMVGVDLKNLQREHDASAPGLAIHDTVPYQTQFKLRFLGTEKAVIQGRLTHYTEA